MLSTLSVLFNCKQSKSTDSTATAISGTVTTAKKELRQMNWLCEVKV
jgi:hypothetical protein